MPDGLMFIATLPGVSQRVPLSNLSRENAPTCGPSQGGLPNLSMRVRSFPFREYVPATKEMAKNADSDRVAAASAETATSAASLETATAASVPRGRLRLVMRAA